MTTQEMSTANGTDKVEGKVWSQIGKTDVKVLYTCTGKKRTVNKKFS